MTYVNLVCMSLKVSQTISFIKTEREILRNASPGVGNSFGFAGHIRDKLGIRGPVHVLVN